MNDVQVKLFREDESPLYVRIGAEEHPIYEMTTTLKTLLNIVETLQQPRRISPLYGPTAVPKEVVPIKILEIRDRYELAIHEIRNQTDLSIEKLRRRQRMEEKAFHRGVTAKLVNLAEREEE